MKIYDLFDKLKREIPNIILRTTFILGFPGETDNDFEQIIEFIKNYRLQNVGFFTYSREEGTRSYDFDNQIDEGTKEKRLSIVSQTQFDILSDINNYHIGQVYDVIIDESYDDYSVGRFYGQCPQIDGIIYINQKLQIGEIYSIKITNKSDYDLEGELYEYSK